MTVKIFQIMKLIETIQFYQNNEMANRGNVKRDFELQGITKGLEYPNYDSNERFCLDGGILKLENDELYFTKLGKILLENIDSTDRFNDVFTILLNIKKNSG